MTALARELIRKKRDGERLSWTEVESFVGGVATGGVTDDQAAAMLMAIFFRGLDEQELAA